MEEKENRFLYRLYCKKCQDFTIHERIYKGEEKYEMPSNDDDRDYYSVCNCGEIFRKLTFQDWLNVDQEKIEKQQKKFRIFQNLKMEEFINFYKKNNLIHSLFNEEKQLNRVIIETDAGLLEVERKEKEQKQAEITERKNELLLYSKLGRNDKCLCNSGKKYKYCCLSKHNEWKLSGN